MIIHAVAQKWEIQNTLYVVLALKPANTITGWLSSVKRVALKRENTQIILYVILCADFIKCGHTIH